MLRIITLTFVSFLALFLIQGISVADEKPATDEQALTLGYVDFPPYEFQDNGVPSGILVEIVRKVTDKAGIPIKLEFLPFKRALNSTKEGVIDGLFNFYKTEERLKSFDYSDPIIKNPLVIFVRKDFDFEYSKLEDLKGLTVGTMRGYSYGTDFDESPLFDKDEANSHISNFKKLVFGRIDAYPCDKLVGIHVAITNGFMSELKMLPVPIKVMDGHVGFTKGKHNETIDKLNKAIAEMHKNGEIKSIINQYIEKDL